VASDNRWLQRHWTNNAAESMNHILKLKADWRQLPLLSVIDNIHDVVKLQMTDLRAALTGQGNFCIVGAFTKHTLPYHVWSVLTEERKASLFNRFVSDRGVREVPKEVTSRDGVFSLPATPRVARKPGQKSRARKTRTQVQKK